VLTMSGVTAVVGQQGRFEYGAAFWEVLHVQQEGQVCWPEKCREALRYAQVSGFRA
jgi:hypothetical protein